MVSVKDLLRAETLAGGARGSAIDTSAYISFTPPAKGESVDYIAPCDGVVRVSGEYKTKGTWNSIWVFTNDTNQNGLALEGSNGWRAFCSRVKKGDKVTVGNSGETSINMTGFFKVIGGGYKRYLPSLSRNRFGGALWLRLKTASETLRKLEAGSRSRLSVASSSRVLRPQLSKEFASTCRPKTAYASFGLRVPRSMLRFAKTEVYKPSRQTVAQHGQKPVFLAPVGKSSTMRYGVRSSKGSSTSFLLSVASNNARMEVAA